MNFGYDYASKEKLLMNILRHAKENTEFYKNTLKDVDINSIHSIKEFQQVPILFKESLVGNEEKLLTKQDGKLFYEYTSGSTGNPLVCIKGIGEKVIKTKDLWSLRKKNGGITPKDRYCMFYAFTEDDLKTDAVQIKDNIIYLSMLDMSDEQLKKYYDVLMELKPSWILGAPSALSILSNFIIENKLNTSNLKIKYIECNGEMLFDFQREIIEKAFNLRVYNHYGCREFWCLAMSCELGHNHLINNRFFYELINIDENGCGELVVTDLYNKTWPLIRYYLGDICEDELSICECCDNYPVVKVTGGRAQEYLKIGEWIGNPILFAYIVLKTNKLFGDCVRQFQVIQLKNETDILFKIEVGKDCNSEIINKMKEDVFCKLPLNINLHLKIVNKFEFNNSKHQYFISNVQRGK